MPLAVGGVALFARQITPVRAVEERELEAVAIQRIVDGHPVNTRGLEDQLLVGHAVFTLSSTMPGKLSLIEERAAHAQISGQGVENSIHSMGTTFVQWEPRSLTLAA